VDISVVIPTLITNNKQLGLTLQCIEQAKNRTNIPFELIIIETESSYLQDYADVYIWERKRTTSTKSLNRAFRVCRSDYIVLLTNDVIVGDMWLECLLDAFNRKKDCGLATLATTQFNHKIEDKIEEGIWFSVAMMPKEYAELDEHYVNSWDDTDLVMRVYLKGKKMYRNYNCVVDHITGSTQYANPTHRENLEKNKKYFMEKFKEHKDHRIYKILTEGWVV